jgi:hypothetical protein
MKSVNLALPKKYVFIFEKAMSLNQCTIIVLVALWLEKIISWVPEEVPTQPIPASDFT